MFKGEVSQLKAVVYAHSNYQSRDGWSPPPHTDCDDYMKIRMGDNLIDLPYIDIQHRLALNYCLTVQQRFIKFDIERKFDIDNRRAHAFIKIKMEKFPEKRESMSGET